MTDAVAPSFDEILALAKPRETVVTICLAGDLAAEADRITAALDALDRPRPGASLADGAGRGQLLSELEEVRELMKSAEVPFRFRAMGDKAWSDLIAAHPSTNPGQDFDPQSMQPHLIAQSSLQPAMSLEQVQQLLDKLNEAQRDELFGAAWRANRASVSVPTSRAVSAAPSLSDAR